jgi:carbon monoxide dehydrogenase subunit G
MPSAERTVTINRPAADVFAFIADGSNASQWRSAVRDIERTSGDGKGAVYRQGVKGPLGRRIAADYEVTVYELARRLEFKAIAGPVRPTGGYRLAESDGKTKVTFWLKGELGGWRRLVFGRSVQKSMDTEMKALDKLKSVLEGETKSAPASKPSTATKAASASKSASATSASATKAAPGSKSAKSKSAPAAKAATPRTARRKSKAS